MRLEEYKHSIPFREPYHCSEVGDQGLGAKGEIEIQEAVWLVVALMSTTKSRQPKLYWREKACASPSVVVIVMVSHQRKPFGKKGRKRVRRLWLIIGDLKGKKNPLSASSGANDGAVEKHLGIRRLGLNSKI